MTVPIARRKFVVALAGAAAWPLAARGQQGGRMRRIGVLLGRNENDPDQKRRLSAFTQALAGLGWTDGRNLRMDLRWYGVYSDGEIETAIIALGREPGGGLVVIPDAFTNAHRASIILAAARNNVPAVYSESDFARDGGLLSYGFDPVDPYPRAASYVDRILRGAKPGDLPVQFPTKFEMVVNRPLGLAVPPSILLRADEVIE
jgi:hypothetical protein